MDIMSQATSSEQISSTPEEIQTEIDALTEKLTTEIDKIASAISYFNEFIELTEDDRLIKLYAWEQFNGYDKSSCVSVERSFINLLSQRSQHQSSAVMGTALVSFSQVLCQLMEENDETPSRIVRSFCAINQQIIIPLGFQVFIPQIGDVFNGDKMEPLQKRLFGKKVTAVKSWGVMNQDAVVEKAKVLL